MIIIFNVYSEYMNCLIATDKKCGILYNEEIIKI